MDISMGKVWTKRVLYIMLGGGLLFLWCHMHLYRLGQVPYEMFIDEFGVGYDSYSMLNYGVDRWLMKNPVYLNNYDSGSSIAYALLCMLSIKIFGNTSTFTLRFPAAVVSLIAMVLIFLIVRELSNVWWAFLAAYLFNMLPYYTMQSRVALDCNLMMCAMLAVICTLYLALKKNKTGYYILAGVVTGVSLYTYILSWVVVPVTLVLFVVYGMVMKRISWKQILVLGICCGLLAWPLIVFAVINFLELDTVSVFGLTIPRLIHDRTDEVGLSNVWESLKSFYKVAFYGDGMSVNALYVYFTMFTISIPFVIGGMVYSFLRMLYRILKKELDLISVVNMVFLAELVLGVILGPFTNEIGGNGINVYRINGVYGPLLIYLVMAVYGIYQLIGFVVGKMNKTFATTMGIVAVCLFMVVMVNRFWDWNKCYFSLVVPGQYCFAAPLDEVVEHFGEDFYRKNVHVDANYAQVLLATHLSPYEFNAPSLEKEGINMKKWRNITFDVVGEFGVIDENAIYIVYREHSEYIEYFEMFELEKFETERYVCFYN